MQMRRKDSPYLKIQTEPSCCFDQRRSGFCQIRSRSIGSSEHQSKPEPENLISPPQQGKRTRNWIRDGNSKTLREIGETWTDPDEKNLPCADDGGKMIGM